MLVATDDLDNVEEALPIFLLPTFARDNCAPFAVGSTFVLVMAFLDEALSAS